MKGIWSRDVFKINGKYNASGQIIFFSILQEVYNLYN